MPKCYFALRHGCSPINLLHIFRTPFPRNTSGRLLLYFQLECKVLTTYFQHAVSLIDQFHTIIHKKHTMLQGSAKFR